MRVLLVILALGALIQAAVAKQGLRANIPLEKRLKKCNKFTAAKKRKCVKFVTDKYNDEEEDAWKVDKPKKKWNRKQFERGVFGCRIGLSEKDSKCKCAEVAEKACAERPEKSTDQGHLDRKLLKRQCGDVTALYAPENVEEVLRGETGLRTILKLCENSVTENTERRNKKKNKENEDEDENEKEYKHKTTRQEHDEEDEENEEDHSREMKKACFSYLSAAAGCEKELVRNRE